MITCKNCHYEFEGEYCPQCSQKVLAIPYTLKTAFPWIEDMLEFDRGYLFTMKQLFTDPRQLIIDYLSGITQRYSNPIRTLLLTAALLLVLGSVIDYFDPPNEEGIDEYIEHFVYGSAAVFSLFVFAFNVRIYRERNITEHAIIAIYESVGVLIALFMSVLVALIMQATPLNEELQDISSVIIWFVLMMAYHIYYSHKAFGQKQTSTLGRSILSGLIAFIGVILALYIGLEA